VRSGCWNLILRTQRPTALTSLPCASPEMLGGVGIAMDLLEGDPGGCLEGTTPANAVDASLSAAEGAGNLPEVSGSDAAAVGIVELGCIAELEGFDAGFEGGLAEQIEALEERDVVLDIARSAELVPARVAQPDVGRGTGGTGAAGGLGERCGVEPVSVGADVVRDLEWCDKVCGLGGAGGVEGAAIGGHCERQSGDDGNDAGDLPSAKGEGSYAGTKEAVSAACGQFIGEALLVVEGAIVIGRGIVAARVDKKGEAAVVV